jgi:hypothetical protein
MEGEPLHSADNATRVELPESLRRQLAAAAARQRRTDGLSLCAIVLAGALGGFLAVFASDRLWDTPPAARSLLAAASALAAGAGAWWWASRLALRRDPRHTARVVQRAHRGLGDSLLGIVELSGAAELPPNISPALVRAAARQVAGQSAGLDFRAAVPSRALRRWTRLAALLALAAAAAWGAAPEAALSATLRWVLPGSGAPRYTFARLAPAPDTRVVPYGEPFEQEVRLAPDSRWKPARAAARVGSQPPTNAPLAGGAHRFAFPGLTRDEWLVMRAGDAATRTAVQPRFRPEIAAIAARVELPAYLEQPPAALDARKGAIEVIEGSSVSLTGAVTRALAALSARTDAQPLPASFAGADFHTHGFSVDSVTNVLLDWADNEGLGAAQPFTVRITRRPDAAPDAACRGLPRFVAILQSEALEFEVATRDDLGVRDAGVVWEYAPDGTNAPLRDELRAAAPTRSEREFAAAMLFAPTVLGIPRGRVTLWGEARDFKPGREASRSAEHTVFVLDLAEHAKLIEQEFQRLLLRLDDIARVEESLLDQSRQTGSLPEPERGTPETTENLRREAGQERENRATLDNLNQELARLGREALRNSLIEPRQLAAWSRMLEQLREIESRPMTDAQEALEQAASSGSSPAPGGETPQQRQERNARTAQRRAGEIAKAIERQREALERMRRMREEMNQAGDALAAANFVNRLTEAAQTQQEVGRVVGELLPRTIGMTPAQIGVAERAATEAAETRQRNVGREITEMSEDMDGFLRRLDRPSVAQVRREIESTGAAAALAQLADQVRDNRLGEAGPNAGRWHKQMLDWAEALKDAAGGGGGGGGGQCEQGSSPEMQELAMELMRARRRQEDLRTQTRALHPRRETDAAYDVKGRDLSGRQGALKKFVSEAPERVRLPAELRAKIGPFLAQVTGAMGDAESLLAKPDTGVETVGAQTEVIELLSDPGKRSPPKSGQSGQPKPGQGQPDPQAMASLSQMMARMQQAFGFSPKAASGGGSRAGGEGSHGEAATGGEAALQRTARTVEGTGGTGAPASVPAEFRDLVEAYFEAVGGDEP